MESGRFYSKTAVDEYLKELSERKIIPGGGSAAALAAALGAGLNLMVMNYTAEGRNDEVGAAKARQQKSIEKLSGLIDADCRAFTELMQALSSGRDAQEEYKAAAKTPMEICKECLVSVEITAFLLESGSRRLITDVGCAAAMLEGAFRAASLNVEINLREIKDPVFVDQAKEELARMKKYIGSKAKETILRVEEIIKKRK